MQIAKLLDHQLFIDVVSDILSFVSMSLLIRIQYFSMKFRNDTHAWNEVICFLHVWHMFILADDVPVMSWRYSKHPFVPFQLQIFSSKVYLNQGNNEGLNNKKSVQSSWNKKSATDVRLPFIVPETCACTIGHLHFLSLRWHLWIVRVIALMWLIVSRRTSSESQFSSL